MGDNINFQIDYRSKGTFIIPEQRFYVKRVIKELDFRLPFSVNAYKMAGA